MIRIEVDGSQREIERAQGRRGLLKLAEIEAALGSYSIEGYCRIGEEKYYILALRDAYFNETQNETASRLAGRMVYGPVLLVERGKGEMA